MCKTKEEAKMKMDRLIESMDRLAAAISHMQPVIVDVRNVAGGGGVAGSRRFDVLIDECVESAVPRR